MLTEILVPVPALVRLFALGMDISEGRHRSRVMSRIFLVL